MSPDLVLALCLVALLSGLVLAARRKKGRRVEAARTVELEIDRLGVRRSLGDGRTEQAVWAHLREVEVVRTPVKTADGARAFVLLDSGTDLDPVGCLVPLGVGYDDVLLVELTRLPGFRIDRYQEALDVRRTGRAVLWQRPASTGNPVPLPGAARGPSHSPSGGDAEAGEAAGDAGGASGDDTGNAP